MKGKKSDTNRESEVLGSLDTFVVGMAHYRAAAKEGDRLEVVREPDNPHDPNALRVNNAARRQLGHLPRSLAEILSPLIDADAIDCSAIALASSRVAKRRGHSRLPVRLEVRFGPHGRTLFETAETARSPADVVHELVVKTWRGLATMEQPEVAVRAARQATEALGDSAHPATRLLSSLLADRLASIDGQQRDERLATVRSFLQSLRFGKPIQADAVTFVPVISSNGQKRAFELIDEAVQAKHAVVEEVDAGPTVNTVKVRNVGDRPILAPQGWLLLGAMQDRVLVFSLVIDVGHEWHVPVCCVEAGRWHASSGSFTSRYSAPPSLRRASLREVVRTESSEAEVAQREVWDEVDAMLRETDVPSETRSLADAYQRHEEQLRRDREAIAFPDETRGMIVLDDGQVLGMDLFADPDTFQRALPSLLDGYFLESLRRRSVRRRGQEGRRKERSQAARADVASVEQTAAALVDRVARGLKLRTSNEQVGDGWTLTVAVEADDEVPELVGSGVMDNESLLHLSVFGGTP
ncbi:MAG: hypothetical protein GXP27_01690 [Planctomycetes bacterium]|nr:hypothetical protein [Planctomycetota bacterium]